MTTTDAPPFLTAEFLRKKHEAGLAYDDYLATDSDRAQPWREVERRLALTAAQGSLIESFTRTMNVLCSSGIWCGDCVVQGPMLARIASASARIHLRWVDRDEHADLAQRIMINQGLRVPTVIFMAEDFEPISIFGDRTLTRYRAVAAKQLGAHCPLPGAPVPQDELNATMQEWLDEFERVHLLLRLSARLREKHGD